MPNTLQEYIDNLSETERREVDRLKAQFLANEDAYRRKHAPPDTRGAAPAPIPSPHVPSLAATTSKRR